MNILQTLFQTVTKPTEPLHAGEAFVLWALYEAAAETRAILTVLLNHAEDKELKELIEHFIADVVEPEVKKLGQKLLDEGINLPRVTPDKPKADRSEIPAGARFIDEQIANMVVVKLQGLLLFCNEGLSRSMRTDLAAMCFSLQGHLLAQGASLKVLMTDRNWLRVPPTFGASGQVHL